MKSLNKQLLDACEKGDIRSTKALIKEGVNVNTKGTNGHTALMLSSQNGHIKCVRALIEAGADVNAKNSQKWTALMLSSHGGHTECVRALIEAGADVNAKDDLKDTALIKASAYGHIDCVKALIRSGADPFIINNFGHTACDRAGKGPEPSYNIVGSTTYDREGKIKKILEKYMDQYSMVSLIYESFTNKNKSEIKLPMDILRRIYNTL